MPTALPATPVSHKNVVSIVGAPGVAGVVVAAKKLDALVASFATTDLALVGTWMRQENTAGQVMTILVTNPQRLSWKLEL